MSRTIKIIGGIDDDSYRIFSDEMDLLESESAKPINIELSSYGGSATDALAFISKMRRSKCPIRVTAVGLVASAATLILAAGTRGYRHIDKNSWVMIHEDAAKIKGRVSDLEREVKHLRRMEDQWDALLEDMTGTSRVKWKELHSVEKYLDASECLALGIVDKII